MGKDKKEFILILATLLVTTILIDGGESLTGKQIVDSIISIEEMSQNGILQKEERQRPIEESILTIRRESLPIEGSAPFDCAILTQEVSNIFEEMNPQEIFSGKESGSIEKDLTINYLTTNICNLRSKPLPTFSEAIEDVSISKAEKELYINQIRDKFKEGKKKIIVWFKENSEESFQEQRDKFKNYIPEFNEMLWGDITGFAAGSFDDLSTLDKIVNLMQRNELIKYVVPDVEIIPLLAESRPLVQADKVETQLGVTGKGIGVCVIDTGIDYTHQNLGGCTTQQFLNRQCKKVVGGFDFENNDPDPIDDQGHGTHVAGIVASTNGQYRGIAPEAHLIALKGTGSASIIAASIDWCLQKRQEYNIKIITMSLGIPASSYNSITCPRYFDPALQKAIQAGMFVDAASGNFGSSTGVSYPACAPGVVSVGATYDANVGTQRNFICDDLTTKADQITCFTNRGAELDILAPGAIIRSTISSQGSDCGSPQKNGFGDCSGTSMAAPHVAGTAALLYEKDQTLRAKQIEGLIENSGEKINDQKINLIFPRVNALAAVQSIDKPLIFVEESPNIKESIKIFISDASKSNKPYLLAFALSNSPGIDLPDQRVIPLTADPLFFLSSTNPQAIGLQNSIGTFDSAGYAQATWEIPFFAPPGLKIYMAFITIDFTLPFPKNIISISPAIAVTTLPENRVKIKSAVLPSPRSAHSCVNDLTTKKIYCIGGWYDLKYIDEILEYDAVNDKIKVMNAILPIGRAYAPCAKPSRISTKLYCFGGFALHNTQPMYFDQILEYDIANDKITTKKAVLPTTRADLSCTGSSTTNKIYCFGGNERSNPIDQIIEYNPISDEVNIKTTKLPQPTNELSCVESSATNKIYCFGGVTKEARLQTILEYDIVKDQIITKATKLPGFASVSCTEHFNSKKIYCFDEWRQQIFEYNPVEDRGVIKNDILPVPIYETSCTEDAEIGKFYCFGGNAFSGVLDRVLEYTP